MHTPPKKPALDSLDEIFERLDARQVALFIDYDGTLTPIVANPDYAELSEAMRATLAALARVCQVAVVSGRALADVRSRVGLERLAYAGSHGFEISGPLAAKELAAKELTAQEPATKEASANDNSPTADAPRFATMRLEKGREFLPVIARVEAELRLRTGRIEGAFVERKPLGVALHYRQAAERDVPTLTKHLHHVLREFAGLRVTAGKKIYDIRPDIDWDKGTAVRWMLARLAQDAGADAPGIQSIYLGDDTTDEDAFRALGPAGITIAVQSSPAPSAAHYWLADPDAVQTFLDALLERLSNPDARPT